MDWCIFMGKWIERFKNKIWLSSPTIHGDEQKYIKEAFDTNWVSTVGENIDKFEESVCEYIGCDYGVGLSSGTAGLHLAVKLADIKQGDIVFCTDMTFAATANPISYEGAKQVFIDSEYDTWNMDPKALEKAFEKYPDTKLVILTHLYGVPAKLDEIIEMCNKYNAILVEDAAESLGATYKGKQTGSFGKYNIISFNGNKIITTSGGGMIVTDDKEAADKARKWSTQSREPFPYYQHEEIGYNYRLSNVLAGLGRGQMEHLEEHIEAKKSIYNRYKEGLKDLPIKMNPFIEDTSPNYWLSCILIDEGVNVTPKTIRVKLEEYNAEARHVWKPMHMQPIFENCDCISVTEKSVSEDIFTRGLCLPSDIKMTIEQQNQIIEIIKSCFE